MSTTTSEITFLAQGAIIQEFKVAGKNIVLSFPTAEQYLDGPFFGETIGRVANRIKDAKIDDLNGKSYQLAANNGPNHLHGGEQGWGKKQFSGPHPENRHGKEAVKFVYRSPDGEEGYPGTVELRVWYTAYDTEEESVTKRVLETEYEVEFVGSECEETTVNVTNHSYFNLSDGPTIENMKFSLGSNKYQVVDDGSIPTGSIDEWPGIEANKEYTLEAKEPDIDHCFIMDTDASNVPLDTRKRPVQKLVGLSHPGTKLHLDIFSTEPAFQFYTGKFIDVAGSHNSPARGPRAGLCVEPSRYINAINVPEWRSQVLLKKGQIWGSKTVYKAWKA